MSKFGELVLLIGDLHIPQRSVDIPEKFKELLVPGKMQHVLCTGNVGNREHVDWLKNLAGNVHIVRGDMDDNASLPDSTVVTVGEWKIGLIHGHQVIPWGDLESLGNIRRQLDCDILVSGHTHVLKVDQVDNKFFLNPGSVSGAYSPLVSEVVPGFILMALHARQATLFIYQLKDGELDVNKTQFTLD